MPVIGILMTGGMTMAHVVGTKGQVVIAKEIRERLGIGAGWVAIQRVVGDHVELTFLPPEHRESLKGSLAAHVRTTVPAEGLERARDSAWRGAAAAREDGTRRMPRAR